MKKNYLFTLLLFVLISIVACTDDNEFSKVDGLAPTLNMEETHIRTNVQTGFALKGKVSDRDGIKNIVIESNDLFLNKSINLLDLYDDLLFEYDLNYNLDFNEGIHVAETNVEVTVFDVLGNHTKIEVAVDFSADFSDPVFTVIPQAHVILPSSESTINFTFDLVVEDDKELALVKLNVPKLNKNLSFDDFDKEYAKFSTLMSIDIPGTPDDYEILIEALDYDGNKVEYSFELTISETPNYPKMYIVEGTDESIFNNNIFGVPMMVERTDDYTYETGYYCAEANTEVRLIVQKTGFESGWFGVSAETNLITDAKDLNEALPILISEAGYNKIKINILSGEYTITNYTPTDAVPTDGFLAGIPEQVPVELGLICPKNWWGHAEWALDAPQMLEQDANNPYLYRTEFEIAAGTSNIRFIVGPKAPAQYSNWWFKPHYKWDSKNDPEANVVNAGNNPGNWSAEVGGTYCFEIDTHLLRSKLYLKR